MRLLPLIAVLAALLVPATADAAVPGLNITNGAGGPAELEQLDDLGAGWARHFISWDGTGEATLSAYGRLLQDHDRRGIKTLLVLSSADRRPPGSAEAYAAFAALIAKRYAGSLDAIEIWNEPDEGEFWIGGPQVDRYVDLLQRSYTAVKAVNPAVKVVLGPLTGANYGFLEKVYAAGGKGFFDVVAAHTDTACLINGPTAYYRDPAAQGRIARFTFLGYRELRATMLAHGDDKPLWLTEIGWSAAQHACDRGMWAGQKLAGVSEADQARFLLEAFHCLEQDPYVEVAMWFNNRDLAADGRELNTYGLLRADGSRRPAYAAFQDVARNGDRLTGPCGDFGAPVVRVLAPRRDTVIGSDEPLPIRATSTDSDVLRMTFAVKGAPSEIRNFTNGGRPLDLSNGVSLTWQGAKRLPLGTHTIVVSAVDAQGNVGTAEVTVRKVDPATLGRQRTSLPAVRLLGRGFTRTLTGRVRSALPFAIPGKVVAEWQTRRAGRWTKVHGAARNAGRPFTFVQRLRTRGRWRVRLVYQGRRPFRASASRWIAFRV